MSGEFVDPDPWINEDSIYESSASHPLFDEDFHDVGSGVWRTSSGEMLKISEMTDRHLRNAIAYAKRVGIIDRDKISELQAQLELRGTK